MKDIKFALLVALITGIKEQHDYEDERMAKITKLKEATFAQAIQYPELVMAMHEQLDHGFLERNQQLFIGEIVYDDALFRIIGTFDQWRAFFCGKWELLAGWYGIVPSHN